MNKTVKIGWVLWIQIEKYAKNHSRKVRGANYLEFVKFGIRISIGVPWAKAYVKYECGNYYGIGADGIESINKEMLNAPGFKIRMPKIKYTIN